MNRLALQRNRRLGETRGSCRLLGASSMWNESPLTTIQIRQGPFARPALPGVLTTMNPSDSPRSQKTVINSRRLLADRYALSVHPRRGVSQVPRLICRRPPSPTTPESPTAASAHCSAVDTRLRHLWQVGHSQQRNEAESGSLALRLTPSQSQGFGSRVTPTTACSATWRTSNYHGQYLSTNKINQASPGTPEAQGAQRTRASFSPSFFATSAPLREIHFFPSSTPALPFYCSLPQGWPKTPIELLYTQC
jgi:hypothetical protein